MFAAWCSSAANSARTSDLIFLFSPSHPAHPSARRVALAIIYVLRRRV